MIDYSSCKYCGNTNDKDRIYQCKICKLEFCFNCILQKRKFCTIKYYCPTCHSEHIEIIGEIGHKH